MILLLLLVCLGHDDVPHRRHAACILLLIIALIAAHGPVYLPESLETRECFGEIITDFFPEIHFLEGPHPHISLKDKGKVHHHP